jgi:hypothetical protein
MPPKKEFAPLNARVPGALLKRDPPPEMTPEKEPVDSVNVVLARLRAPEPVRLERVCVLVVKLVVPFALNAVAAASEAVPKTLRTAPAPTLTFVLAREAVPINDKEPEVTLVAPVYVFTPLKVSEDALVFVNPPDPLMSPAFVPPSTLTNTPVPMLSDPPLRAVIVLLAFRFKVPALNVDTLADPVTVVLPPLTVPATSAFAPTTPPVISEVNRPATFTVPLPMPPP